MADRPMKIPWSDHPISIEANPSRVFGSSSRRLSFDGGPCPRTGRHCHSPRARARCRSGRRGHRHGKRV